MKTNRLAAETSPYLLQHATNPVDWHPWGERAFAEAKTRNVPVFLSIGYSTCHWCHVMERESFEHLQVAELLNRYFVCIKVDREERPDIDGVYMTACQMLTGSGGWPLNLFLLPDRRPFFAATYIPRESTMGRMGMLDLAERIHQIWTDDHKRPLEAAERICSHMAKATAPVKGTAPLPPPGRMAAQAVSGLKEQFDTQYAGFGTQPKFPSPHNLSFLVRMSEATGEQEPLRMALSTLRAMRRGGIYDQVGFGLHRYSTTRNWLLPHFEKMLYDQALFTLAALDAHAHTADADMAQAAKDTLTYALRDLRSPDGTFFSAEDADSEGVEGRFYVWTMDEVRRVLDGDAELYLEAFGFTSEGNYAHEASGKRDGTNIPHRVFSAEELGRKHGLSPQEVRSVLESCRLLLLQDREKRVRPHRDEKILADQNGLMLAALARAARVLGDGDLLNAAVACRTALLERFSLAGGKLAHTLRGEGDTAEPVPGLLDDYACVVWGLLELHECHRDEADLNRAAELGQSLLRDFLDDDTGGFYHTPHHGEELPVRLMDGHDGATPSGNAIALHVLKRLGKLLPGQGFGAAAQRLPRAFANGLLHMPQAHCHMLEALLEDEEPE